jgi:hypothetical protein
MTKKEFLGVPINSFALQHSGEYGTTVRQTNELMNKTRILHDVHLMFIKFADNRLNCARLLYLCYQTCVKFANTRSEPMMELRGALHSAISEQQSLSAGRPERQSLSSKLLSRLF